MLERWLGHLDKRLGETKFLAGDNFPIADLTAFISIETTKRIEFELPDATRTSAAG